MKTRKITSWLLLLALTASPAASFAMPFWCGSPVESCCCGSGGTCDKPTSPDLTIRRADMCCPTMAALDTRMQVVRTEAKEVIPVFDLTTYAAFVVTALSPLISPRTVADKHIHPPSGRDRTIFLQTFLI